MVGWEFHRISNRKASLHEPIFVLQARYTMMHEQKLEKQTNGKFARISQSYPELRYVDSLIPPEHWLVTVPSPL